MYVPYWQSKKLGYDKDDVQVLPFYKWVDNLVLELEGRFQKEIEEASQASATPRHTRTQESGVHYGWQSRMAKLLNAIDDNDWDKVEALRQEYNVWGSHQTQRVLIAPHFSSDAIREGGGV